MNTIKINKHDMVHYMKAEVVVFEVYCSREDGSNDIATVYMPIMIDDSADLSVQWMNDAYTVYLNGSQIPAHETDISPAMQNNIELEMGWQMQWYDSLR